MLKYSVIIPAFCCENTIANTVNNIRNTGLPDYEILLIEDGSPGRTSAVCDDLAERFPEVRVVHQANAGASAARNRGIQEAVGELLLFIDADDSIDSAALGKVLSDPRCRENDLTIFGLTFDYYHNGKCYRRDPLYFRFDGVLDRNDWGRDFMQLYRDNSLSPVWNKVFKRDILLRNGLLLNPSMFLYEDFEFVLRYLRCCDTIWNVPQAIYHYRQSEDEGNAGRRLKRIDSIPEFLCPIEKALNALPETVSETDRAMVLQQLHLVLAREKIAVSEIKTIKTVCQDYRTWSENRVLLMGKDQFQQLLLDGKAFGLYLRNKKTQLRHWVAVRVKAFLKRG